MKQIRFAFALMTTLMAASVSLAAPSPKAASSDEIVKLVLQRHVVLQGTNSKGALGADAFALKTAKGLIVRANLRANSNPPSGGASSNPEAFHMNMNMTTPAGTTPTMQLRFSGRSKETAAHTRILTYETPIAVKNSRARLVAYVNQHSNDGVWQTSATYIRLER